MLVKEYRVWFPHDNNWSTYDGEKQLKKDLEYLNLPLSLLDFPDDETLFNSSEQFINESDGCSIQVIVSEC